MGIWKILFCFVFTISFIPLSSANNNTIYQDIVKKIFSNYDPGLRPTYSPGVTIIVDISFGIIQLLNVEEVSKTIDCVSFMEMVWQDEILKWEPEEFQNVSRFRYPHNKVWKPDIILTNTPDLNDGPVMNQASTNVIISHDGKVTNSFTAVYKATCREMDMTNFPFDAHKCYLDFASWTYSGNELDIFETSLSHDLPASMKLIAHSEWDIEITNTEKLVEYECCPNETYPTLRINIALKRKPLYFLINIIIPTTITCYISFIGMFSPSSSSGDRLEKAFLGITTLLAVSLLMLTVSAQMPVTSTAIPLMGFFLGVYILTIAIAIICTAIIMHIDVYGLRHRPLPKWAKSLFLEKIGRCLCVYEPDEQFKEYNKEDADMLKTKNYANDIINKNASPTNAEMLASMEQMLNQQMEMISEMICESKQKNERDAYIRREWSQLSTVLDRMCLIFFITWSTLFTIIVLLYKRT